VIPGGSLKTSTPEERRQLAVTLARLVIKSIRLDADNRTRRRAIYATDHAMLPALGQSEPNGGEMSVRQARVAFGEVLPIERLKV
jgi:hypothetical protein